MVSACGGDRLHKSTASSGNRATYCYDPVGNRVSTTVGCAPTIAYDQADRMTSATVNGTTTASAYNGDGPRMGQASGGTTTGYAWDVDTSLPQLLYDGTRYYLYGLGLLYSFNPQGTTTPATGARQATSPDNLVTHIRVYHADGPGSVRALTTDNGLLADTYQTDAFGADATQQGLNPQPFGYAGQQADNDGLVYLRARYYDPASGRFMSRDPLAGSPGLPLSLNRYTYVRNSPATLTDPAGRCSEGSEYAANNCEDNPSATDNPDSDNPELSPAMGLGGSGGGPYFPGTSAGFAGNPSLQQLGVTSTSTNPAIATNFATYASNFGQGVVHIATRADLAGLVIGEANVLRELEEEVAVYTTPADFAARASITITVGQARAILAQLGVRVPIRIAGPEYLSPALRATGRLTAEQVARFVELAKGPQ